jgi:hypothetical protein
MNPTCPLLYTQDELHERYELEQAKKPSTPELAQRDDDWKTYREYVKDTMLPHYMVENYDTAKEAFDSLNIGQNVTKRLVTNRLRELYAAANEPLHGHFNEWTMAGRIKHIDWRYGADHILFNFFKNQCPKPFNGIFHKSVRAAQVNGTDKIVIFSDCYDTPYDKINIVTMMDHCAKSPQCPPLVAFEKTYTRTEYADAWEPRLGNRKAKVLCGGYSTLSRGMLLGFIIG